MQGSHWSRHRCRDSVLTTLTVYATSDSSDESDLIGPTGGRLVDGLSCFWSNFELEVVFFERLLVTYYLMFDFKGRDIFFEATIKKVFV